MLTFSQNNIALLSPVKRQKGKKANEQNVPALKLKLNRGHLLNAPKLPNNHSLLVGKVHMKRTMCRRVYQSDSSRRITAQYLNRKLKLSLLLQ
uniref:Uncharacterized protein n=1 Tax=Cryptococcus bacillisporus CA1280 TaxID=1296109 RepID=A0A0D0VIT3_CRYGA|nr:hypothetical protein I312_04434 [Cryptococcus bacillisporus CA1280]